MMPDRRERARRLTRGVWLVGIGLMLLHHRVWPDLLFILGAVRLGRGHLLAERRSTRTGAILIAVGFVVTFGFALVQLMVLAGAGLILVSLLNGGADRRKPAVDMRLE